MAYVWQLYSPSPVVLPGPVQLFCAINNTQCHIAAWEKLDIYTLGHLHPGLILDSGVVLIFTGLLSHRRVPSEPCFSAHRFAQRYALFWSNYLRTTLLSTKERSWSSIRSRFLAMQACPRHVPFFFMFPLKALVRKRWANYRFPVMWKFGFIHQEPWSHLISWTIMLLWDQIASTLDADRTMVRLKRAQESSNNLETDLKYIRKGQRWGNWRKKMRKKLEMSYKVKQVCWKDADE